MKIAKLTTQDVYDIIMRRCPEPDRITVDAQLAVIKKWFEEKDNNPQPAAIPSGIATQLQERTIK